jgi:hypothetical protein
MILIMDHMDMALGERQRERERARERERERERGELRNQNGSSVRPGLGRSVRPSVVRRSGGRSVGPSVGSVGRPLRSVRRSGSRSVGSVSRSVGRSVGSVASVGPSVRWLGTLATPGKQNPEPFPSLPSAPLLLSPVRESGQYKCVCLFVCLFVCVFVCLFIFCSTAESSQEEKLQKIPLFI